MCIRDRGAAPANLYKDMIKKGLERQNPKLIVISLNGYSVSYTHLDVYKRQSLSTYVISDDGNLQETSDNIAKALSDVCLLYTSFIAIQVLLIKKETVKSTLN